MKILIVGLGSIGDRHARLLEEMGHEVIGVDGRPVDELNMAGGHSLKGVVVYPALSRALGGLKYDAAIIATPPARHVSDAIECLQHHIPVLIEKPLTLTVAETYKLKAAAVLTDAVVGVGMMERAHLTLQKLKQRPVRPRMDVYFTCHWQATPRTYPWPGVLHETAHTLDLAYWLFGDVCKVEVRALEESHARIILKHTTEVVSHLELNANRSSYRRIAYNGYHDRSYDEFIYGDEDWDDCYRTQLECFLAGRPLCTLKDGIEVVRLTAWIEAVAKLQEKGGQGNVTAATG